MQDIDTQRDGKSLVAPWTHDAGRKPGNDIGIVWELIWEFIWKYEICGMLIWRISWDVTLLEDK